MMTYAGIQMFMENLKQLMINPDDNPHIKVPSIIRERPQFQLLYDEFGSMIQTLFNQELNYDHQKLNHLKERFVYVAEEAEYIVDLFLSGHVHIKNNEHVITTSDEVDFDPSLNLDDVWRSFKSVEIELMSMNMDSSQRPERTLDQQISISGNSLVDKKSSDKVYVGLDHDVELIRDKLVEDQKKVDVVSIVGMGGIGKTTLATKVFNDGYVKHHFHVRVWVTVSQTYVKRDVLTQILESIRSQLDLEKASDSWLGEMVHKRLMGKRYLIVIDDIWHVETWDNIKLFFPHDNNGSRILLTSRLTEVAKHANSNGFIHHLGYLNIEKSWELLCQMVFHGNECPEWSIKPGMQIVESCKGLPLALIVIAGVLAKEAWSEKFWVEVAYKAGSYIVEDPNGCMETLALSYNHLPLHLRECFLYLGGFPEDYVFQVQILIWLWVVEGFIQQAGNQCLEDIAQIYLLDLIERNLVIVLERSKSSGAVKTFKLHDLVRELCLKKAKEDQFILKLERLVSSSQISDDIIQPYKLVRMFINKDINVLGFPSISAQNLRSILFFSHFGFPSESIAKYFGSFVLLRVLDLKTCRLRHFPDSMELLVHLRYLAVWNLSAGFPSSICNLWSLQTLVYITRDYGTFLPSNISDMVNLRHLCSYLHPHLKLPFVLPSIQKPMNLHTLSYVDLRDDFQKCFPCIKELNCCTLVDEEIDFESLTYLEKLKLTGLHRGIRSKNHIITFPATLKSLTLYNCYLLWSDMSVIHSLPNLEVLKLKDSAFDGSCWNTDEQEFRQLNFFRLEWLNIKLWEAYSTSFPCLKQLQIFSCKDLEEIPLEIGDIPTLELIEVNYCSHSVDESVRRVQQEQQDLGNYGLKIDIIEANIPGKLNPGSHFLLDLGGFS